MIVYSKKIIQFINDIKYKIKNILSKEVGLKVFGDRFYDQQQQASYPINVVIYNNRSMLGYLDTNFYELGFHECLMLSSREQLHNVIRHEIAHFIAYINYGTAILPHGTEFRSICQSMGWDKEIYNAAFCLESEQGAPGIEESSILRKVQKLMALAGSSNKNEAEQAMIKSQQLLFKHNIETKYINNEPEEKISLKRIMKQKRENAKMRAIANILGTFFVNTIYRKGGGIICLEILGNAVNIEIAEYVANVLHYEMDNLWEQAKQSANLSGKIAKNSFFFGLAKGYCNKIQALKREYTTDAANALMVIEKQLVDAKAMVYQRLSASKSSASYCPESSALGEQMGRQLNINSAINQSSQKLELPLF